MSQLPILVPDPDAGSAFVRDFLFERPWSKQDAIVRSVFTHRQTVVASCTGAGKTRIAAAAALAWAYTGPYRTVITTAPTGRQVRELLWKEIRKLYRRCSEAGRPLGGTLLPRAPELRIEEDWAILGFSSNDDVNLQGWHTPGGTLFILDEAVGVKPGHWEAIISTLTGEYDRLLALGNPTEATGKFHELYARGGGRVNAIKISAFETPNVVAGGVVIPGLVTSAWIDDRREAWGEDSPLWKARVLGEFPDQADNVLLPISWMDAAIERWRDRRSLEADAMAAGRMPKRATGATIEAGLDVARYGADKTIIAYGVFTGDEVDVAELLKRSQQDTMQTAGWSASLIRDLKLDVLRVDADGLGAGVFDRLNEQALPVVEMRGGTSPSDKDRFVNARSEWLWTLRELLRPDATVKLLLPPDDELVFQATSIRYKMDSKGRIAVESKDEWRKRTKKRSTDELDAVAYMAARIERTELDEAVRRLEALTK